MVKSAAASRARQLLHAQSFVDSYTIALDNEQASPREGIWP